MTILHTFKLHEYVLINVYFISRCVWLYLNAFVHDFDLQICTIIKINYQLVPVNNSSCRSSPTTDYLCMPRCVCARFSWVHFTFINKLLLNRTISCNRQCWKIYFRFRVSNSLLTEMIRNFFPFSLWKRF